MQYVLHGLRPSAERLSFRESMATQARAQSPVLLWTFLIAAIAFVVASLFILVVTPDQWPVAIAGIVFFGAAAAVFGFMLVLRQQG